MPHTTILTCLGPSLPTLCKGWRKCVIATLNLTRWRDEDWWAWIKSFSGTW